MLNRFCLIFLLCFTSIAPSNAENNASTAVKVTPVNEQSSQRSDEDKIEAMQMELAVLNGKLKQQSEEFESLRELKNALELVELDLSNLTTEADLTKMNIKEFIDDNSEGSSAEWITALTGICALCISIWAVWLVRQTLVATQKAVASSDDAVKAANDAVLITADIGDRQMRAYVGLEGCQIDGLLDPQTGIVRCSFKNFGQVPAYKFTSLVSIAFGDGDPEELPVEKNKELTGSTSTLFSGNIVMSDTKLDKHFSKDNSWADFIEGRKLMVIIIYLSYKDHRGIRRYTTEKMYFDYEKLDSNGSCKPTKCISGQDSN